MTGYNVGEDLHRYAEAADGSFARRVQSVAKALGVAIVYGYPERCDDGMFNSAAFIDANGDLLAWHRRGLVRHRKCIHAVLLQRRDNGYAHLLVAGLN